MSRSHVPTDPPATATGSVPLAAPAAPAAPAPRKPVAPAATPAVRRRPRDRRTQIIRTAGALFGSLGYHRVGITDIAAEHGISSAALYRHFASKSDLLAATIDLAIAQVADLAAEPTLEQFVERAAREAPANVHAGVLWAREQRHLPPADQERLRRALLTAVLPLRAHLERARPELARADVDLLLWALLGLLLAPGTARLPWTSAEATEELRQAIDRLVHAPVTPGSSRSTGTRPSPAPQGPTLLPASRTEAILSAARHLFSEKGFLATSVEDIGTVVGITAASVYHHFPTKSAVLLALMTRTVDYAYLDLSTALSGAANPEQALVRALQAYLRLLDQHGLLVGSLTRDLAELEDADHATLRARLRSLTQEWTVLVRACDPTLSPLAAKVRVQAAFASLHAVSAIPHLVARPSLLDDVLGIGCAVLGLPDHRGTSDRQLVDNV